MTEFISNRREEADFRAELLRGRTEYDGLQVDRASKMNDLERKDARLRRLAAGLPLEKRVLADVAAGNLQPSSGAGRRSTGS